MLSLLRRLEADPEVLGKRTLTALALAVAVGAGIFAGPLWAPVLILAALALAGAWEWIGLAAAPGSAPVPALLRVGYLLCAGGAMGAAWWISSGPAARNALWVLAALWWLVALLWLARRSLAGPAGGEAAGPGSAWLGEAAARRIPAPMIAAAGLLTLVPAWLALARVHVMSPGPWPLVIIIALVVGADMGAYFTGRLVGRHRLVPRISPGKTWEGLAGGLATAALVAVAATAAGVPMPGGLIPVAVVLALVSVLGDLTVSMFKRHAGVKHSGVLLPGHGGVLDRIDSFCSAAPAFAVWLTLATDWL